MGVGEPVDPAAQIQDLQVNDTTHKQEIDNLKVKTNNLEEEKQGLRHRVDALEQRIQALEEAGTGSGLQQKVYEGIIDDSTLPDVISEYVFGDPSGPFYNHYYYHWKGIIDSEIDLAKMPSVDAFVKVDRDNLPRGAAWIRISSDWCVIEDNRILLNYKVVTESNSGTWEYIHFSAYKVVATYMLEPQL